MKKTNIILAFAMFVTIMATAQHNSISASFATNYNQERITFVLPSEKNVAQYRIEAGNDSVNFTAVAAIPSKGNTVFARTYNYTMYTSDKKYYRVAAVTMQGITQYSNVLTRKENENPNTHPVPSTSTSTILAGR
ncbi:MAG: hypothetical protein JNM41_02800 [Flavipsychrobacter sp.]|nr:hypothetical protein [Flavipsychrobacter sp.]